MKTKIMKLDVKKTNPTPKDKWEAIELLIKAQGNVVDALFIMDSAIQFNTEDYKELHEKRMKDFIKKFVK